MDLNHLRGRLASYFPATLQEMLLAWGIDTVGNRQRPQASWPELLAKHLLNPENTRAQLSRLSPLEGEVLHRIQQLNQNLISRLRTIMVCGGHPEPQVTEAILKLARLGLLLPVNPHHYGLLLPEIFQQGLKMELLSGLGSDFSLAPAPKEQLEETHPELFGALTLGDPGRFASALHDLLALTQRRRLSLTQKGWLNAAQQGHVLKAIPTSPMEPGALVQLARGAQLLEESGGELRPGPDAAGLAQPMETLLYSCFWNVLGSFSTTSQPDGLRAALVLLRTLAAHQLCRMEAGRWVPVDAWIERMLELHPSIGLGIFGEHLWDSISRRRSQRAELVLFLLDLCLPMGLIDVAGPLSVPPTGHVAGDGTFRAPGELHRSQVPVWRPPSTKMAFRVNAMGSAVLRGESVEEKEEAPRYTHVTPDFEVMIPRTESSLLYSVGRAAVALQVRPGDPVRRFRLERDRWVQALQSGLKVEEFIQKLEESSGRPLPANVRTSLDDWGRGFGELSLLLGHELHRFSDAEARNRWIKQHPVARAVGERDALAPAGEAPKLAAVDYRQRLPPCVILGEEGELLLDDHADLLAEPEMEQLCEKSGESWKLTRKSVIGSGWSVNRVRDWLNSRPMELPGTLAVRVMGWAGGLPPLAMGSVELLQVPDLDSLGMYCLLPELTEHLVGLYPPHLMVLRPGSRPAVEKVLAELRIRIQPGLEPVPMSEISRGR